MLAGREPRKAPMEWEGNVGCDLGAGEGQERGETEELREKLHRCFSFQWGL